MKIYRTMNFGKRHVFLSALITILCLLFSLSVSEAAEVIVIGDMNLKPVVEVVSGIKATLKRDIKIYSHAELRDSLNSIVEREGARAVIALGKDALNDALHLPSNIQVIYGLIIAPPRIDRQNTTGIYMSTPVSEYIRITKKYLPLIKEISVVSSRDLLNALDNNGYPEVTAYNVNSSLALIRTVKQINDADALLLLPDVSFMTNTAIEEIYLYSFRKNIPLLGISEKYVKSGALFAAVFDPDIMGRQIGEIAAEALRGSDIGNIPPAPSRRFKIYLNRDTAKKMGIRLSDEMIRSAERVYP